MNTTQTPRSNTHYGNEAMAIMRAQANRIRREAKATRRERVALVNS